MATLPQRIGATERLLTRVLLERALAGSAIHTNDEWVVLNRLAASGPVDAEVFADRTVDQLRIERAELAVAVDALTARGVIAMRADGLQMTEDGERELQAARTRVAELTEELERDVTQQERRMVDRVLTAVAARARALLA